MQLLSHRFEIICKSTQQSSIIAIPLYTIISVLTVYHSVILPPCISHDKMIDIALNRWLITSLFYQSSGFVTYMKLIMNITVSEAFCHDLPPSLTPTGISSEPDSAQTKHRLIKYT